MVIFLSIFEDINREMLHDCDWFSSKIFVNLLKMFSFSLRTHLSETGDESIVPEVNCVLQEGTESFRKNYEDSILCKRSLLHITGRIVRDIIETIDTKPEHSTKN